MSLRAAKPNHGQRLVDKQGRADYQFQAFLDELERGLQSSLPKGAPIGSQRVVNIYHDGTAIKYELEDGTVI